MQMAANCVPALVLNLKTGMLQMVLLKIAGCVNFYMNFTDCSLGAPLSIVTMSVPIYLPTNPVQHQHRNHVEIDLHFIRGKVSMVVVRVLHVPTTS